MADDLLRPCDLLLGLKSVLRLLARGAGGRNMARKVGKIGIIQALSIPLRRGRGEAMQVSQGRKMICILKR